MISVVKICNLALSRLGHFMISDITEASEEARQCNINYETARDAVLREFPWNFALSAVALSQSTQRVPGWTYAYHYPACLTVRRVYAEADARSTDKTEYRVMVIDGSKFICTDAAGAYADITCRISDPTLFDSQFVEALSYKLAIELSIPLTGNSSKKQELYQEYKLILASAQTSNTAETYEETTQVSAYVKARS